MCKFVIMAWEGDHFYRGEKEVGRVLVNTVGHVDMGETKVSMRTSLPLTDRVMHDEIPGLNAFLPEATLNLGGFADACHRVSAATTIKIGKEALLMDECENVLKKLMNK